MPARTKFDLRAQAGQTMILGFDGVEKSAGLRRLLQAIQPAGVILFARNIKEPRQTWELLRECQKCVATPMFLCVDMEGGAVDRLRDVVAPAPSAAEIAVSGNRKLFRRHGLVIGQECRALGFNTDFAPVVDLAFERSRPVLASRAVSSNPQETTVYAREFLRGLQDAGMLGCGKHFPGLGEADLDTHHKLAVIKKPWRRLWEEDLHPYRVLHRRMPFIMVAHAAYSAVTQRNKPASVSRKWISDILRKKIGYRGLIVSDDLEMGGVQAALSTGDAAVATIKAGADLFLVCHSKAAVWESYENVLRTAEKSRPFAARVKEAAGRVFVMKKRHLQSRPSSRAPSPAMLDTLRRCLWELSEELSLNADCHTGQSEGSMQSSAPASYIDPSLPTPPRAKPARGGGPGRSDDRCWEQEGAMIVAGIMSGTSVDGIDVALVRLSGRGVNTKPKLLGHAHYPFPTAVRRAILRAINSGAAIADLARLNFLLGGLYAEAILKTQRRTGLHCELIGCHGQTIYHQGEPARYLNRKLAVTSQIGESAVIAARCGIPVISDFRPADMAAGGKGAPLVPFLDYLYFRHAKRGRIVQNLGGIGNLTAIPPSAAPEDVIAFDTGPSNMVIDGVTEELFGLPFDKDGRIAARGTPIAGVVSEILRLPFFRRPPPRTAGREDFGRTFAADFIRRCGHARKEDVVATATLLTARSIGEALPMIARAGRPAAGGTLDGYHDFIVSGGGVRNSTLMRMIATELQPLELRIRTSDEFGLPAEAKEAIAFAVLAYQTWHRRPGNLPSATGARHPAILGKISFP